MSVSFSGVGMVCATFLGQGLSEGQMVKLSGGAAVAACGDGEAFCGAVAHCGDGACSVQVKGFLTVGYSGTAPGAGPAALCGNGTGGVRASGEGDAETWCQVADVDTAAKTVTVLL